MTYDGQGRRLGGFRLRKERGEPIHIAGRKLTPVARILSFGRARGTFGTSQIGGWVGAFAQFTPLEVIVETDEGDRRLAISDATGKALWGMRGAGAALTLLLMTVRWWARRLRKTPDPVPFQQSE
jgi:hypothetical protein